jgi:hypothetical protein
VAKEISGSKQLLSNIQSRIDELPDSMVSYMVAQMCAIFDAILRSLAILQHTGRPCSSSSSNSQNQLASSSNATRKGKRRASGNGDKNDSTTPGSSGNGDSEQQRTSELSPDRPTKRWACPFYQRNPDYYCMKREFGDYRACTRSGGFDQVHRIK